MKELLEKLIKINKEKYKTCKIEQTKEGIILLDEEEGTKTFLGFTKTEAFRKIKDLNKEVLFVLVNKKNKQIFWETIDQEYKGCNLKAFNLLGNKKFTNKNLQIIELKTKKLNKHFKLKKGLLK